ncbi:MAG: hypothetical protein IKX45_05725 [Bacteroidales bacterium]|nr:hypothetical protein [Bacteroidales bacterium]
MKQHLFAFIAFLGLSLSANAQVGSGALISKEIKLFDFSINAKRFEAGFNFGQAASFSEYARLTFGANLMIAGVYLDFLSADPEHKYSPSSDTKWNDHKAVCINAGYQFPILKWLRIMPLIGYAQTNDGITDASVTYWDYDEDSGSSTFHPYKVTPGSRQQYFNYGGGLSIQPCKWFSINLIGTRHAIYGGFGLNLLAFAGR